MTTHTVNDVRWTCACGRFISASAIREQDYLDPNAYYGIGTRTEYDCRHCGTVQDEPVLVVVATRTLEVADGVSA